MKNRTVVSPRFVAAAVFLPCIGLFLLMPPMIQLFALDRDIAGIPLIVFYLFGVWLGLIVGAGLLSRRLSRRIPPPTVEPAVGPAASSVDPIERKD